MRTVADRVKAGQAVRKTRPRASLASWMPQPDRRDPVAQLLDQEKGRVPALLPLRHARMAVSPFTFYRGAAVLMASDLGSMPNSGITVQLCGDAHVANFGIFAGQDRQPVFDVNDFDETNPGPFEWDVMRLVTSFVLAARDNGFDRSVIESVAMQAGRAYREAMTAYAAMPLLSIWYDRIDAAHLTAWAEQAAGVKGVKAIDRVVDRARARDGWSAVAKLTSVVGEQRRFLNQPPVLVQLPLDDQRRGMVMAMFDQYKHTLMDDRRALLDRYSMVDMGHKVVGVGSVGLRAFVILLQGRDENDLLVLQAKQAVNSVLEPYTAASTYSSMGQRVVEGQRIMQAASDAFLGWVTGPLGRSFYIRQLRDMKWSPDLTKLTPASMLGYAALTGATLAHAHARSGDAIEIAGYLGRSEKFDAALVQFGMQYSEQVALDYAEFQSAISSGRITASENLSLAGENFVDNHDVIPGS